MTTALITGMTGQDGSDLAELLPGRSYRVVGPTQRSASTELGLDCLRRLGIHDAHRRLALEPAHPKAH